ncbi:collagen alpha-4(VI) chain-like [Dreissena polymorpha]|uniref:collagen alpha-4(VI) chain-like n=1 Tax=Dreissena polymorpha TaxID=45954 RepID=UPI002263C74A|nr:collagen alpha-4(VI) chain-like [Dreissena polymorpha]
MSLDFNEMVFRTVFAIGIGGSNHELNKTELEVIASDKRNVHIVQDFDALNSIYDKLKNNVCTGCNGTEIADIVFILDASESVKPDNFNKTLQFVNEMIDAFFIGPTNMQIAVLTFSTNVNNIFHLNNNTNKIAMKDAVNNSTYTNGYTYTNEAIKFAREFSFKPANGSRPNAAKIAIIVTDEKFYVLSTGNSTNQADTISEAEKLQNTNVIVFAIGVGNKIHQTELEAIASKPYNTFMFRVDDYSNLTTIIRTLATKICKETEKTNNGTVAPTAVKSSLSSNCAFEEEERFCDWSRRETDLINWVRHQGPTDIAGKTGPGTDVRRSSSGNFIFVDASNNTGRTAKLRSANFPLDNYCVSFNYHMYGKADSGGDGPGDHTGTLRLKLSVEGTRQEIWTRTGNQGNKWQYMACSIRTTKGINGTLFFELDAAVGKSYLSDMAVDNVSIQPGACAEENCYRQGKKTLYKRFVDYIGCFLFNSVLC